MITLLRRKTTQRTSEYSKSARMKVFKKKIKRIKKAEPLEYNLLLLLFPLFSFNPLNVLIEHLKKSRKIKKETLLVK